MPPLRPSLTRWFATFFLVGGLGCGEGLRDARWFARQEAAVPDEDGGRPREDGPQRSDDGSRRDAPASDALEPDGGGLARECQSLDPSGGEVLLPDARLFVPFKALAQATQVCLAQASPRRRAALGHAWDVTVDGGSVGQPPTLEVTFRPPDGLRLDQIQLAYLDRKDGIWVYIPTERMPPATLRGPINNLVGSERASQVAVVLTCGAACPAGNTCTGNVCQ